MAYNVVWHERALSDLRSLERTMSRKIIERVKTHLSQKPEKFGKPLKGVLKGLYRYRFGDYRIVYTIDQTDIRISILYIGHRKDVYR